MSGRVDSRVLGERSSATHGRCVAVRFDLGSTLPVYVMDAYPDFDRVVRFTGLAQDELEAYVEANRVGMQHVLETFRLDGVVVNHAVMGPYALRPLLERAGVPYVVKVHGSDLEYAIAQDERYVEWAREGLAGARQVLVGSGHIRRRTLELLGDDCAPGGIEEVPPGVDGDRFHPVPLERRRSAWDHLVSLARDQGPAGEGRDDRHAVHLETELDDVHAHPDEIVERLSAIGGSYDRRSLDVRAGDALYDVDPDAHTIVTVVAKLIHQKGVQLVIAAMPLVAERHPEARFVIAGFGPLREALEALVSALARGDLQLVDMLTAHGEEYGEEGGSGHWRHLPEFFAGLRERGEMDAYLNAAATLRSAVCFTGPLTHEHLPSLWGCARVNVVPSVFPEAFGMVAAEAASCGALPVVALQTGLGEVGAAVAEGLAPEFEPFVGFRPDEPDPVRALAAAVDGWCSLDPASAARAAASVRKTVVQRWSWDSIARRLVDALA